MNTVQKVWIVCRQHYNRGERFHDEKEAVRYAEILAQKLGGETVEVFTCISNLKANIPVVMLNEPDTQQAA